ncbi:glycosyltransferase family 2 protein [Candidatus Sulfidibacterium hydrothermale]|uniref:glycosyltransferase n=1 Tax=Candidatus Sulfidibacterium hydrothermale TaxID=2875962 RepID=UPI001F0AB3A3|nr:glycosyltransferase family 2 protein [Candidatus Sulfidibacterium hydrothermale]UBM63578.1 glycosyltransferase family 2 protein [Candidatus Sulfidibacterium hydrothermale]
MMLKIWHITEMFFFVYLAFTDIYLFIFAVSGLFPLKRDQKAVRKKRKIQVLIPGYREDAVILDVAKEALRQDYGTENYDVVIIADGFLPETIQKLKAIDVQVVEVKLECSTKSRALNAALAQTSDDYDIAVVLDADNIMAKDFLTRINAAFCDGYLAVQGHRVAKNLDTPFAILDAVSEEMNNHIFRKGHRVLRLSSALIGSAMAFDYLYFKKMMKKVEVVGGFDKELEVRLLQKRHKIEYLPDAYVYDEKVPNAKVFTKQRRRWLSAQVHYFGKSFLPALRDLFLHGNIDFFNKALQFILLPRIMLISLLFVLTVIYFFAAPAATFYPVFGLFITAVLVFLLSIPPYFYNFRTLWALTRLPAGIALMFFSFLHLRGSNKEFLHTKHTYNAFQIKHPYFYPKNKKK